MKFTRTENRGECGTLPPYAEPPGLYDLILVVISRIHDNSKGCESPERSDNLEEFERSASAEFRNYKMIKVHWLTLGFGTFVLHCIDNQLECLAASNADLCVVFPKNTE